MKNINFLLKLLFNFITDFPVIPTSLFICRCLMYLLMDTDSVLIVRSTDSKIYHLSFGSS